MNKILGVEEKARGKLEIKSEKEVPDSDCKTTKFQKPVERKLKENQNLRRKCKRKKKAIEKGKGKGKEKEKGKEKSIESCQMPMM